MQACGSNLPGVSEAEGIVQTTVQVSAAARDWLVEVLGSQVSEAACIELWCHDMQCCSMPVARTSQKAAAYPAFDLAQDGVVTSLFLSSSRFDNF